MGSYHNRHQFEKTSHLQNDTISILVTKMHMIFVLWML